MQTTAYTIELRNIHLYAHHGVMEQERLIGAWFTLDISMEIEEHGCLRSDAIEGTVSYADVYSIACREMKQPSQLLENACYRISQELYGHFSQISSICITLAKDTPPMGGDRLNAAVTIRSRR